MRQNISDTMLTDHDRQLNTPDHILKETILLYRILMVVLGGLVISSPANAEDISTDDVYACSEISENATRLSCYDEAVGRLKAAEDAGDVVSITRQEFEQVKRDSFGFSIPSLPKLAMPKIGDDDTGAIDKVSEPIKRIAITPDKKLIVTLRNGQIWRQIGSDTVRVSKKSPPSTAVIKKAALGSFMMKLDSGRSFRAKRIE